MTIDNIKKVGVVLRPSTPSLKNTFFDIKKMFESYSIEVILESSSAKMIDVLGQEFDLMCKNVDMLLTIGGDGTLISAARNSYRHQTPILGVHAGKLGFLADIALDELDLFIQKMLVKDYCIDKRAMLEAVISRENGTQEVIAFNDIVITRPSISKMISLETFLEDKLFNTYFGDGVIISTPTGSTAYNLSAGGPLLLPHTQVFAITPISPHSLTQRPVVLPGHFSIEIKTPDNSALAIVDGQDMYEFGNGDSITINLAQHAAHLIHKTEFNYFDVLREKLRWGD
ncbi:MAG: NAD(+)/NADH kinase [Campylobacterota bacterium]|nr:NAD(+)/NADH kinase [Campylobacterota bacterium]